jgi:hypothetical protein
MDFKIKMKKLTKLKIKFWAIYTVIGIAQPLALLFPLAWPLRFLKKWNPLWFVLDDTRIGAEDYRVYLNDFKFKPLGVLSWHVFRNRVWNFTELVGSVPRFEGPGNQNIEIIEMITDNLTDGNGNKLKQDGPWVMSAGLKYIGDPGEDPWQINRGEIISKRHSIIGEGEIIYKEGSNEFWRYSSCKLIKPWWSKNKKWRTIFLGCNSKRYAFNYKFQKNSPLI